MGVRSLGRSGAGHPSAVTASERPLRAVQSQRAFGGTDNCKPVSPTVPKVTEHEPDASDGGDEREPAYEHYDITVMISQIITPSRTSAYPARPARYQLCSLVVNFQTSSVTKGVK